MTHRQLRDALGVMWDVWEVHPSLTERRLMQERRIKGRVTPERRRRAEPRALLPSSLRTGWLAFQSSNERRRRAPIPEGWESLDDGELRAVLEVAEVSGKRRRLIE